MAEDDAELFDWLTEWLNDWKKKQDVAAGKLSPTKQQGLWDVSIHRRPLSCDREGADASIFAEGRARAKALA